VGLQILRGFKDRGEELKSGGQGRFKVSRLRGEGTQVRLKERETPSQEGAGEYQMTGGPLNWYGPIAGKEHLQGRKCRRLQN